MTWYAGVGTIPGVFRSMADRIEARELGAVSLQRFAAEYAEMGRMYIGRDGTRHIPHAIHVQEEAARYARLARIDQGIERP